jgi:ribonuclease J
MELGEQVPTSYVFVDGSTVGEVDADVMREREILARDGIVLVNLTLDRFSGGLRREAQISARGFVLARDTEDLIGQMRRKIADTVGATPNGNLAKEVEQKLSNFLYSETRRRPMIYVTISRE